MSVCFKCQKAIPDDSLFCCYCGAKQELTCPACGAVLPPDSLFCNKCGKALYEAAPAQPEAPSPAAPSVEATPVVSAPAESEATPSEAEQTAPTEPKKRGRKPVEKMPVGNPTPGFPNVSGFYNNPYANISPSEDAVVIGMGRWIARVDKNFNKTIFDVDDFGTYESFLASCQNADGIWVVTQEGFSYSHMPITLHYLDHNMKRDKSKGKKLLDHGPNLSSNECVMRDKLFAFCSLDDKNEEDSYYKTLRINRYSIPSGREVVQNIPYSAIPYSDGQILSLHRVENVLTDGLSLYVKLEYRVESTWIDDDDGDEHTYVGDETSWLKINLRSSKVENLECGNCFFDFDRGLMWRELNSEDVEKIAPDRVQVSDALRNEFYGVINYLAASAIAKDAPILVSQLPVLIASDNIRPLAGDDNYGHGYWCDDYQLYSNGNTHAYFDGAKSIFINEKEYYTHQLYQEFTYKEALLDAEYSFTNVLLPKMWPENVLCPYTSKFHSGIYPPVFWQGKVLTCNQNTGTLKLGVYPAWWEGELTVDMLKEI